MSATPRSGPPLGELAWSLVNLILAAAGLISAGVYTARHFAKKKQKCEEERQDFENSVISGTYAAENVQNAEAETLEEDAEEKPHKRMSRLFTACIFSGISAILFIIFQNMNNPMVLIDFWTITHTTLFIGEIIAIKKINEKDADNDEDGSIYQKM